MSDMQQLNRSYDRSYLTARPGAFQRSRRKAGVICQLCGWFLAVETHHWAGTPLTNDSYPEKGETTPDDLIALCNLCHHLATVIRRMLRYGVSPFAIRAKLGERINSCDMK